jgi:hypothetical protein
MTDATPGHSRDMWWGVLVAMWFLGSFPAAAAVGRAIAMASRRPEPIATPAR